MKLIQKKLAGLGGILLAAILIAALAPKATRGVAAALVQVANTSANPVPNRDIDNGPRQGVTLVAGFVGDTKLLPLIDAADRFGVTPYTVPAGKRLLVQFISGQFQTPAGAHIFEATIFGDILPHPGTGFSQLIPVSETLAPQLLTAGTFNIYQVSQPVWFYEDAGATLRVDVELTSGNFATNGNFLVRGYLVDCTDACP